MAASRLLKIFLSYAFDDNAHVRQLYSQLVALGADPWLDAEKLLPGQDWKLEISKALDEADVIILCLTQHSVSKEGYVQKEMRLALDRGLEMPEGRIFLIPAKFEPCEMPYSLKGYQWVDLFADHGMDKLVKSLNLRADQVGAKALVPNASSAPVTKPREQKEAGKNPKAKSTSGGTVINIQGNVTGSTIVIGDDNKVDTD